MSHMAQKSELSPQGRDLALLDPLAKRSDALDSVDAITVLVETAELVVVQTAASITPVVRMCDMAQCRTAGQIRNYERDLPQRDERLGQPLGERHRSLCPDEVPIEAATSTEGQVSHLVCRAVAEPDATLVPTNRKSSG